MANGFLNRIFPGTTLDARYNPGRPVALQVHDRVMDLFHQNWKTDPIDAGNLALASTFAVVAQFREDYDAYIAKVLQANNNPTAVGQVRKSRDAFEAAFAATEVYIYQSVQGLWPNGYRRLAANELPPFGVGAGVPLEDPATGLYSALYVKDAAGQAGATYILASRGTDDRADYLANAEQNFGLPCRQYEQGLAAGKAIAHAVDAKHGRLLFAGHSLGGGIATLQAMVLKRPAFTFQAAGVSRKTRQHYGVDSVDATQYVTTFDYPGDWLDIVQIGGLAASLPLGRKVQLSPITLPPGAQNDTLSDRHLMNFVVPAMLDKLKLNAWP